MAEVLRVLMVKKPPTEIQQMKKLLAETEHSGRLPSLQVRCESAADLEAAGERLAQGECDVLLLGFSGPDDLERLAGLRQDYPALPVVAWVDSANESLALLALAQGACAYLLGDRADARELGEVLRHAANAVHSQVDRRRLDWLEENITDVVWRARPDLNFVEMTDSIARLAGYSVGEALSANLVDWIVPDFRQALQDVLLALYSCEAGAIAAWRPCLEVEHLHKNGAPFWAEISMHAISNEQGQLAAISGVTRDISSRHALQERLDYMSMHDPLTDLFNRAYFLEELKRLEFSRMYPITVLLAELEGLKTVNYQYGMTAGDDLIKKAAQLLRAAFRSEDLVARIGGDEFIAIMPHCNPRVASRALQRVVNLVEAFNEEQPTLSLSMSLGVATAEQGQSLMDTIKAASAQKYNRQNTI